MSLYDALNYLFYHNKTMKNKFISIIRTFLATVLSLAFVIGCSTKDNPAEDFRSMDSTRSGLQYSSSQRGILVSQNQIPGILKGYLAKDTFPSIDKYTLKTVSEDGYNLIYVVNFDAGGWVLVSGILFPNASPILGFSFEGMYDPDAIESPEAAFWLEATKRKIAEQIRANL